MSENEITMRWGDFIKWLASNKSPLAPWAHWIDIRVPEISDHHTITLPASPTYEQLHAALRQQHHVGLEWDGKRNTLVLYPIFPVAVDYKTGAKVHFLDIESLQV